MDWTQNDPFFEAHAASIPDKEEDATKIDALMRSVMEQFQTYIQLSGTVSQEILPAVAQVQDPVKFADIVATHLNIKVEEKQKLQVLGRYPCGYVRVLHQRLSVFV